MVPCSLACSLACLVPESVEHDGVEADDEEQRQKVRRDEEDRLKEREAERVQRQTHADERGSAIPD